MRPSNLRKITFLLWLLMLPVSLIGCTSNSPKEAAALSKNIIVYGDSRTGHDTHKKIVKAILKTTPGIVFHTGDMVKDGNNSAEWERFNEITFDLRKVALFYPTQGNHEKESKLYYDNFLLPNNERWYSVIFDKILFVVLNSNINIKKGSEQFLWLKQVLESVDGNKIRFTAVMFHHPAYSSGYYGDRRADLRESIIPLFEKNGVDIVFNGHEHSYERLRINNVYYLITGGGGVPLRPIKQKSEYSEKFLEKYHFIKLERTDNRLNVTVFDEDLNVIDGFSMLGAEPK